MIITSIVECVDEDGKPTVPYDWYNMNNLPSGDYVPGVKELIPKAFEIHKLLKL
jgi:hypothetical protein